VNNKTCLQGYLQQTLFSLVTMDIIHHYFPQLTPAQVTAFEALEPFYKEWNAKINVISRKDIDNLYENHVLHALSIAKIIQFKPYTKVIDIGTGGGFPGIPLAIMFPKTQFYLIDSIGKKIKVVQEAIKYLNLTNVEAAQQRIQAVQGKEYDFALSRGVAKLDKLVAWSKKVVVRNHKDEQYNTLNNGLIVLKGGNLRAEIASVKGYKVKRYPISKFFNMPFYTEKSVLHVCWR